MSKYPSFTAKRLLKILQKEGFKIEHISGSHYILYTFDRKRRATVPFHGGDLPKSIIRSIEKMSGVNLKK